MNIHVARTPSLRTGFTHTCCQGRSDLTGQGGSVEPQFVQPNGKDTQRPNLNKKGVADNF